ncbi:hypothetical protein [Streptosporangium sp. NPDC050280]
MWATRNGRHLTDEEINKGLYRTIDADNVTELAQQLRDQEELEA